MGDTCSKSVYKDCCADPKQAIKVSDKLAKRILEGAEKAEEEEVEPKKCINREKQWMERIECMDRLHSNEHQLTMEAFEATQQRFLKILTKGAELSAKCSRQHIIDCLRRNDGCALSCSAEIKQFEDCIDAQRLILLKTRLDEGDEEECDEEEEN